MAQKFLGILLVGLCYLLVGSSYPVAQEAVNAIPTWTFMSITFFIGFLFQLPLTIFVEKTKWTQISAKEWGTVAVMTLLGNVLYTAFLLYGMSKTSATAAAVISSATPAVVLLLSLVFLKEKLRLNMSLSIALAIFSVVMMTLPDGTSDTKSSFTGLLLLSLSTLSSSIFVIIAKKFTSMLKPWTLSAAICLLGFIFTLPLFLSELRHFSLATVTKSQVITLIYYGIFVWALPIYFCMVGIRYISATTAGMLFAFIPVASVLTSVLFFAGKVRTVDMIAIVLVILSVIISEVNFRARQKIAQPGA